MLGLQLAAHLAIRRLAPNADGTLLPIAGLLNGLGYVFIVRLDEAKADPKNLAGLQSAWVAVGIAAFIATLLVIRRVRDLERYRWTIGFLGIALLLLPLVPGIGREYFGARIWVSIGPINFQPGEFAKILLAIFFASYLVEKRELLAVSSRRVGPVSAPRPEAPRSGAAGLGGVAHRDDQPEGPRQLAAVLRAVRGPAVGGHRAGHLPGRSALLLFAVGAVFAHSQFAHVQDRVDIWLDPWAGPEGRRLPDRRGAVRLLRRRRHRHGHQPRQPDAHPARRDRLHLRRHR